KSRSVKVRFKNVDGIDDQGNTMVRCRGANVGTVKRVTLSPDRQWAELEIAFKKGQEKLAQGGALFWVVRPSVGAGMVRGLETVMSGAFVQIRPGDGAKTNLFIGAEEPPPVELPGKALDIVLLTSSLGSLQEGSPIFYRGVQVGEMTTYQLGGDAREVVLHARIHNEYAPLVRQNSMFWNAGGIDMHFGLMHGVDVKAESAKALISGAVEMATPDNYGPPAADGTSYVIQEKSQDEWKKWSPLIPLQLPAAAKVAPVSSKEIPATTFHQ
ncbi:MAG TPA: MlaD family protein, partial [Verrucomicrobiae bacterium]|nr:MlaD family protein [Verrucomicrobiae bacterium]